MKTNLFKVVLFVCLTLSLVLSACGANAPAATPTITITNTPVPPTFTPTVTLTPTKPPTPTITPDIAATQQYQGFSVWLEKLASEEIIPSTEGKYNHLEDYSKSFAKSGYYTWVTYEPVFTSNFIIQAKVTIANSTTENVFKSACGFVFGSNAVFFALDGNVNYRTDGRDHGSNYLDASLLKNPEGVILTLIVNDKKLTFFVNDRMAYTDTTYGGPFSIGPSVLSGTSEGFGTRCDFTEMTLWEIK